MPTHRSRGPRPASLGLLAVAAVTAVALGLVAPAATDTSPASTAAVHVVMGATPLLAASAASNTGSQPRQVAGFAASPSSILPPNPHCSDGRLGQPARANPDGSSSACAGRVSSSAIGDPGPTTSDPDQVFGGAAGSRPSGPVPVGLARTGIETGPQALVGLALIAAGIALVRIRRRMVVDDRR